MPQYCRTQLCTVVINGDNCNGRHHHIVHKNNNLFSIVIPEADHDEIS
jgi:hypothetical protein